MTRPEKVYLQMTSYSNYKEMNGISREWFIACITDCMKQSYEDGMNNAEDSDAITKMENNMEEETSTFVAATAGAAIEDEDF